MTKAIEERLVIHVWRRKLNTDRPHARLNFVLPRNTAAYFNSNQTRERERERQRGLTWFRGGDQSLSASVCLSVSAAFSFLGVGSVHAHGGGKKTHDIHSSDLIHLQREREEETETPSGYI